MTYAAEPVLLSNTIWRWISTAHHRQMTHEADFTIWNPPCRFCSQSTEGTRDFRELSNSCNLRYLEIQFAYSSGTNDWACQDMHAMLSAYLLKVHVQAQPDGWNNFTLQHAQRDGVGFSIPNLPGLLITRTSNPLASRSLLKTVG
jgi:hypothetical protein